MIIKGSFAECSAVPSILILVSYLALSVFPRPRFLIPAITMHPCLLSLDIFSNILDHALTLVQDVDPFRSSNMYVPGNPTLASLARTCKAFMEPTLDTLWRSQVNLVPLVQTFPEDVWSQKSWRYADTEIGRAHV